MHTAEREDWRAKMAAQRKVDVETFGGMGEASCSELPLNCCAVLGQDVEASPLSFSFSV